MECSSFSSSYLMFNIVILLSLSFVFTQKALSYRCYDHEMSILLQFKQSFAIDESASGYFSSYPKVSSWNTSKDCCIWDGIYCDEHTGHVIGIDLSSSLLFGSINSSTSLFRLVHLRSLNLADNDFNRSHIPTRGLVHLSKLTYLNLSYSGFSGEIPLEILHLPTLSSLDLSGYSLALNGSNFLSLIHNLTNIKQLVLTEVNIDMPFTAFPENHANLSSLTTLDLAFCGLYGDVPSQVFNLPKLQYLDLSYNYNLSGYLPEFHSSISLTHLKVAHTIISGMLPASIGNLSFLTTLDLSFNKLEGQIPSSFYKLKNLEILDLSNNQLNGTVDLELFLLLNNLSQLSLSDNNLSIISSSTSSNSNTTISQLKVLELNSCKLTKFPEFIRNQTKLSTLSLSNNYVQGLIPIWIYNTSVESLMELDLSYNSLTGYDRPPVFHPISQSIDNMTFPIPPPSIFKYDVSNNALKGEISPLFCNLTSLGHLYLSDNSFSGKLPPCLLNQKSSLYVLKLEGNYFDGTIPDIGTNECNIRVMMLSENQFEGELPKSLANCTRLEILDVGNNQIKDTFPFWLETLTLLKVLVLRFNKFNGAIRDPGHQNKTAVFPKLHIIDLSHNFFSGRLPSGYFQKWDAMKVFVNGEDDDYYYIGVTITNKGTAREYWWIQNSLNLLNLSYNRFEGEIPELIGNLKGLTSLCLSNNFLTGQIPSSLGNLSYLEVLDLSHNKLSGEIPQHLAQLNFLGTFSVAHNNLTGPIPHGKQFDTFMDSSYEGNIGLCGKPLSEECGDPKDLPPPSPSTIEEGEEKGSVLEFGWKPVVIGYGCGLVVGIVVTHFVINWKYYWFVQTFRIRL